MQRITAQCRTVQNSAAQCSTVQYSAAQAVQYSTGSKVQNSAALCTTLQHTAPTATHCTTCHNTHSERSLIKVSMHVFGMLLCLLRGQQRRRRQCGLFGLLLLHALLLELILEDCCVLFEISGFAT